MNYFESIDTVSQVLLSKRFSSLKFQAGLSIRQNLEIAEDVSDATMVSSLLDGHFEASEPLIEVLENTDGGTPERVGVPMLISDARRQESGCAPQSNFVGHGKAGFTRHKPQKYYRLNREKIGHVVGLAKPCGRKDVLLGFQRTATQRGKENVRRRLSLYLLRLRAGLRLIKRLNRFENKRGRRSTTLDKALRSRL